MNLLLLLVGFLGLIFGGNLLVRAAVSIAQRLNISPMVIGLTLVGFGTSTPELLTSVQAAFAGAPGIAVGNVVGSNIANVLLILGISALLSPIVVDPASLKRDGFVMVSATFICLVMILFGTIHRSMGLALVCLLGFYLVGTILRERRIKSPAMSMYEEQTETQTTPASSSPWADTIMILLGLGVTLVGARWVIDGAVSIAFDLGVSEAVVGLTVVAIGTSLPELVTSVIAARKGQSDVALGNVIGSNIFNILGILGVTSLLRPISVPAVIASLDIWVMTAAALLLLAFAWTGSRIDRREGAFLLGGYVLYLGWMVAGI